MTTLLRKLKSTSIKILSTSNHLLTAVTVNKGGYFISLLGGDNLQKRAIPEGDTKGNAKSTAALWIARDYYHTILDNWKVNNLMVVPACNRCRCQVSILCLCWLTSFSHEAMDPTESSPVITANVFLFYWLAEINKNVGQIFCLGELFQSSSSLDLPEIAPQLLVMCQL